MLNKLFDLITNALKSLGKFVCNLAKYFTGKSCVECESSNIYTVPEGVTSLQVRMVGGSGGGIPVQPKSLTGPEYFDSIYSGVLEIKEVYPNGKFSYSVVGASDELKTIGHFPSSGGGGCTTTSTAELYPDGVPKKKKSKKKKTKKGKRK